MRWDRLILPHLIWSAHLLCGDPIPRNPKNTGKKFITTLVFKVKNVPSALYKALGGFATNGVNMLKLESYQIDGSFKSTQFYTDLEGHLLSTDIKNAISELEYYSEEIRILGVYPSARDWFIGSK